MVLLVGVLALAAGAAVSGLPSSVPDDVVIDAPPSTTNPAGTITTSFVPPAISEPRPTTATSVEPVDSDDTDPTDGVARSSRQTRPTESPSTSTTLVPESGLRVAVVNATNAPGVAAENVATLSGLGYTDATATNAVTESTTTSVYFSDGFGAEGRRLARQIAVDEAAVQPQPRERLTLEDVEADLWLVVGADRVP